MAAVGRLSGPDDGDEDMLCCRGLPEMAGGIFAARGFFVMSHYGVWGMPWNGLGVFFGAKADAATVTDFFSEKDVGKHDACGHQA